MDWTAWAVNIAFLGVPPVSCLWGWWLWRHNGEAQLAEWRQQASTIGLVTLTLSIATGAFAMLYWRQFPGGAVPPEPTRIATLVGFGFAVFAAPFAFLANAWMRVALVVCCAGLMGFYFGMFVAP
jgi:hypothetical protein